MNAFTDTTVEPLLWLLADWSLRWAVLIGLYAAWLLLARPRRAAPRYQAGLGVLLACLLLTAVPRWGPGFAARSMPAAPAPRAEAPPLPAATPNEDLADGNVGETAPADGQPAPSPAPPSEHPRAEPTAAPPAPEPLGPRRLLCLVLAGVWLTGVALLLVRLAIGFVVLGRLRRTAGAAPDEALRLLAACRAELGLHRRVGLAVHPGVQSPITLGLFRPTVLVPPAWSGLPEPARRGSLLHELAHLARRDDWTALLLEVVRAGFFFHPPLHWLRARLERERELLCDEAAVRRGVAPAEYARMLVAFARRPGRLSPGVSLPVGGRRTVQVRIHHLLEDPMDRSWKPLSRASAAALALTVLGLALGVGSFRVHAVEPPPQPAAPNRTADEPPPPAKPAPATEQPAAAPNPLAVPLERLTFGGKTFHDWLDVMQTELKPELRIEAINALGAFGQHGYGPDAAAAIVDLMKGYKVDTYAGQDRKVILAACQVLGKIGSAALPVLLKEMKSKDRNHRRFAFEAVKYINDFPQIRPALAVGLTDPDVWIRRKAVYDLTDMIQGDYSQGYWRSGGGSASGDRLQKARDVVPLWIEALKDRDDQVRGAAISGLATAGKQDQTALAALVKAARSDASAYNRAYAYSVLFQTQPDAKVVGSLYLELLKEKDKEVRRKAMGLFGPRAKEAIPALIQQLTTGPKENRAVVLYALVSMRDSARGALPELRRLTEVEKDPVMKGKFQQVIQTIDSSPWAAPPLDEP